MLRGLLLVTKIWVLEFVNEDDESTTLGVFSSPEKAKEHVEGIRPRDGYDEWHEDDIDTEVSWLRDEVWFQISGMWLNWIDDEGNRDNERAQAIMSYALRNSHG